VNVNTMSIQIADQAVSKLRDYLARDAGTLLGAMRHDAVVFQWRRTCGCSRPITLPCLSTGRR
jgi:hypothetical protein